LPLLRDARANFDRVIVSTGATYDSEIEAAAKVLEGADYSFLHCVTIYPTPLSEFHLARMNYLRSFTSSVGWSDHSLYRRDGIMGTIAAMYYGAQVIERHFTILDRDATRDGPVSIDASDAKKILDLSGEEVDINRNYMTYDIDKEDSVLFKIEMEETFRPIMDSVEREIELQDKRYAEMKRLYNEQHENPKQYASLNPRVGKHLFALHWISWEKFGSVNIKKINNKKFSIKGSQKDDKGNYVTIEGILIPVVKGKLSFTGEIVTRTSGNNNGIACTKKGTYTFLCAPDRKYWRFQEMYNCEGGSLVDYVDIFF
jgi:hypothetical protein